MRIHQDWNTAAFDHPPAEDHLGPFPGRGFLQAVTPTVELVEGDGALLALERDGDGAVRMAGPSSLTDYHSPLGTRVPDLVAEWWRGQEPGTALEWDSLPQLAAGAVEEGLALAGAEPVTRRTAVTAVLHLPATYDEYLQMVGKKERHEIRRKARRYHRQLGEATVRTEHGPGWGFEEFVRLHRQAAGAKGRFMDDRTEALFRRLADLPGWRVDLLADRGGGAAACVFGYSDADSYYLYNSSFDPAYSASSPGVVLLSSMIEKAVSEGLSRFDFLKGDETYKRRLGAVHRPLYTVSCRK
ncbi:MAG: GNAT family N-acetyltransferase [bacterium]|nr:GNAT family N-acetyltransferase [bacterium]MDE0600657.1 GNAT family N-acetyltransferase [bacterium]